MIREILNFVRIRNSVEAFSLTTGFSFSQGCDLFSPHLSSHDVVSQPARARKVRGQCAARKNDETSGNTALYHLILFISMENPSLSCPSRRACQVASGPYPVASAGPVNCAAIEKYLALIVCLAG